jgi:hypothetical protein
MALIEEFEAAKKRQAAHALELHPSSSKCFGRFDPVLKITPNTEALVVLWNIEQEQGTSYNAAGLTSHVSTPRKAARLHR